MKTLSRSRFATALAFAALVASITVLASVSSAAEKAPEQALFTLDESVWATFYDLPSRRFRAIRDAFIRKDFDTAARDLKISIGFLSAEAGRTAKDLAAPLAENIGRLEQLQSTLRDQSVSVGDLDAAFSRAHWLMAQHYLVLARQARDTEQHNNAGHYLWATAHHLERAVLWSNARVDRETVDALESIRKMGSALQTSKRPARIYRDKPIALTAKTLINIGDHLNRKVWIRDSFTPGR